MPEELRRLTRLLLTKASAPRTHWRAAVLSHYVLALLGPALADTDVVADIAAVQFEQWTHGSNVLVKVRLAYRWRTVSQAFMRCASVELIAPEGLLLSCRRSPGLGYCSFCTASRNPQKRLAPSARPSCRAFAALWQIRAAQRHSCRLSMSCTPPTRTKSLERTEALGCSRAHRRRS